jgi:hypothetical protein
MAIEVLVTCGARRFAWAGWAWLGQRPWTCCGGWPWPWHRTQNPLSQITPRRIRAVGREQLRVCGCPEEGLAEPPHVRGAVFGAELAPFGGRVRERLADSLARWSARPRWSYRVRDRRGYLVLYNTGPPWSLVARLKCALPGWEEAESRRAAGTSAEASYRSHTLVGLVLEASTHTAGVPGTAATRVAPAGTPATRAPGCGGTSCGCFTILKILFYFITPIQN